MARRASRHLTGVATGALTVFLELEQGRPLCAHVARHNAASIRVLEKCGFVTEGEEPEGLILVLGAPREGARA